MFIHIYINAHIMPHRYSYSKFPKRVTNQWENQEIFRTSRLFLNAQEP